MPKYRKKPVEIEAIQWHEKTMMMHDVLKHFGGLNGMGASSISRPAGKLLIETLEGTMTVSDGDWIIRGVKGELYPCKPDIFEATYEPADPTPVQPDTPKPGDKVRHKTLKTYGIGNVMELSKSGNRALVIWPNYERGKHAWEPAPSYYLLNKLEVIK